MRFWLLSGLAIFCLIGLGLFFSKNGIKDWIRMHQQMESVQANITKIEESNRELRRRMDLLDSDSQLTVEHYIRSSLGWVRPGEKVYLEPN